MKDLKKYLELRKFIKRKKPHFIRQDTHKKPGLKEKWRKPKGLHSKIRRHLRGRSTNVSPGYGSPRIVKHLHKSGLMPVLVNSVKELKGIEPENQGIILSRTMGMKNRILAVKEAIKLKLKILNIRDPSGFLKECEDTLKQRKEMLEQIKLRKEKKKAELKKKEDEKKKKEEAEKKKEEVKEKGIEETLDKVEQEKLKKEQEKKEMDKLLIKKSQ